MIINHNIPALNTYSQLTKNNKATAKSLNKLSSGQKINTAADDASGLAISEKMRSQIRGLDQASANAQDGISLVQTAEGNLAETEDILQRIRELADKSANDTNVADDRNEIQKEINQLTSEINRIGNTTEFNTMKLLNGGGTETKYNVASPVVGGSVGTMSGLTVNKVGVSQVAGNYTITITGSQTAGSTIMVGGQAFTLTGNGGLGSTASAAELAKLINENEELKEHYTVTVTGSKITFIENAGKATGNALTVSGGTNVTTASVVGSVAEVLGESYFKLDAAFERAGQTVSIDGVVLTASAASEPGPGEFKISDDVNEQAKSIAAAINSNTTLGNKYIARAENGVITMIQREGNGSATAVANANGQSSTDNTLNVTLAGEFDLGINTIVKSGGKLTVDGVDIAVVDDVSDERLTNGTAILASQDIEQQARRLTAAINTNSDLKDKYAATVVGEKVHLKQKDGKTSMNKPTIESNTSSTDGFQAKLQIGANSFQSMTVNIEDMRAQALGIVGTKAGEQVVAKGSTAQYTAIKNVNNGTDDENVEYALDVSTHERATAALDVLDEAIAKVSAERSKLGAFQNRLEHTINNLGTSSANMTEAESRIRDTDMAKEMMAFQKNNILSQAAQSMLAQANQLPQGVLQLLQ